MDRGYGLSQGVIICLLPFQSIQSIEWIESTALYNDQSLILQEPQKGKVDYILQQYKTNTSDHFHY